MPRRKAQRGQKKATKKSNGTKTNGTKKKKPAWTPQQRGSAAAWMERLGYTPATLRCRSLADMTEAEIAQIELMYNAKVLRPIIRQKPAVPT